MTSRSIAATCIELVLRFGIFNYTFGNTIQCRITKTTNRTFFSLKKKKFFASCCYKQEVGRIVNGQEAAAGELPYQVSITWQRHLVA